jgi:hypothetical protein
LAGHIGICEVQTGSISAIQTILQLITSSAVSIKIKEIGISFNGISNTATPIDVQALLQTTAGTASAGTVSKVNGTDGYSLATTSQITFTAEPTAGTVFHRWFIHPQTGFVYVAQPGAEIIVAVSSRFAIRLATAPSAGVSVNCYVIWEE